MTSEIIKQFNNIVESFLSQLSPLIGSNYLYYFKKFIKINSILPIKNFIYYTNQHKEKILKRDESYFLNKDNWAGEVNKFSKADYYFSEIFRLNKIWDQLDKKSKKNIWDFFQALLYLSDKYSAKTLKQNKSHKLI